MGCRVSPCARAAAIRLARPWWASHRAATPAVRATAKLVPWPWPTASPPPGAGLETFCPGAEMSTAAPRQLPRHGRSDGVGPGDRDALVVPGRPDHRADAVASGGQDDHVRRDRPAHRPLQDVRRKPAEAHRDHVRPVVDGVVDGLRDRDLR